MKVSCCFLYVIQHFGYPPSLGDLMRALRMMRRLGFNAVELEAIGEQNLKEIHQNRGAIRDTCEELGLSVVDFSAILPDLVDLDTKKRSRARELYKLGVELAVHFGAGTVQLDSYTAPLKHRGDVPYREAIEYGKPSFVEVDPDFRWPALWGTLVETVVYCNGLAREAGLRLVLEPRVGEIVSNTGGLLRLMDSVEDANFGAVLETAHLNAQKEILVLSEEKLADRIYYLHVADNDGRDNRHLALGEGNIVWRSLFSCLEKHRFDGWVAVDVGGVADVDAAYVRSLRFLRALEKEPDRTGAG